MAACKHAEEPVKVEMRDGIESDITRVTERGNEYTNRKRDRGFPII